MAEIEFRDFQKKVFNIKDEPMPRGSWWWWFWLFFFNNPENPEKPRQLMILWSTKNVKEIDCNNLRIKLKHPLDRSNLDGAVAVWYFDGEKMHHNYLLEQCNLAVSEKGLSTDSSDPTSFSIGNKSTIKIGDNLKFIATREDKNIFSTPEYHANTYIGNMGYNILRLNKLNLTGTVDKKSINGSAYFQRVFVNAPAIPWYWGLFHFENGGILTYFNPNFLGKSIKKDISLFDGEAMHTFNDIHVRRSGGNTPTFNVYGENENEKINFTVNAYAHSSWTFRKRSLGFIPNKLVYNEYPATLSDLTLTNKKTEEQLTLGALGNAVGNAEHTTGFLL